MSHLRKLFLATTTLLSLYMTPAMATTCLKASVTIPRSPPVDVWYCMVDGSHINSSPPEGGGYRIIELGSSTSTLGETHGPTMISDAKKQNILCGANQYGQVYPHVAGYTETFVDGFGYEGQSGESYVLPRQSPVSPNDTKLEGDTRYPDTLLYHYGWHDGWAYDHTYLDSYEYPIYVLVHERGHQNGIDDDREGGLNDQAGLAAALAYRHDNHARCPR